MEKLFFDDIRNPPDTSWDVARNVEQAKEMLVRTAYDVISLDHDIGFALVCPDCGTDSCPHFQTGTDLARWLADGIDEGYLTPAPKLTIIHSFNPEGADRMREIIGSRSDVRIAAYGSLGYLIMTRGI